MLPVNKKQIQRQNTVRSVPRPIAPVMHPVHALLHHGLKMSHPGRSYLAAITHPFEAPLHANKVPQGTSSTQPISVRTTFDFVIGTTGNGFVCGKPNLAAKDALVYSLSNYAAVTPSFPGSVGVATVGVAGVPVPKPYSLAQLTSAIPGNSDVGMQYRLVSAGIRIQYTGSELNRSGTAYTITTPRNDDVVGVSALNLYTNFPEVGKVNIGTSNHVEVSWHAKSEDQLRLIDFNSQGLEFNSAHPSVHSTGPTWDYTTASAAGFGSSFGIIIAGAVPGITFTGEYIEHWEFSGFNVGLLATPCMTDIGAINHAHSIMSSALISMATASSGDRTEHIAQSVVDVVKRFEPELIAGGVAILGPEAAPLLAGAAHGVNKFSRTIVKAVGGIAAGIRHMFGIH